MPNRKTGANAKAKPPGQLAADQQRYNFALNPYPDSRCSTCPTCGRATSQRKLPLLIHIDPKQLIALNYTCRYCVDCNLLIGHQHELEGYLTQLFRQHDPTSIGNSYLVMGVIPRRIWKENMADPKPPHQVLDHLAQFLSYRTLQRTMVGWFPKGVQPPIEPPAPSKEWVKRGAG